jgi:hypothetical protein
MSTARDFVKDAMVLTGAAAVGETPTADELTQGITTFNRMLASWSNESLLIFNKVREAFALTAAKQSYTMGTSGTPDFNTTRPQKIENALIQVSATNPTTELPIQIVNKDEFAAILVKSTQSSIQTKLYVEGTYPNETLNFWPIPSTNYNVILYSWKPLVQIATPDDVISLPPGFDEAIEYNLAIRLSARFGRPVPPDVAEIAREAKASLKRMNSKPEYLACDAAVLSRSRAFNWLTGESG